jgi:hypothetical protein
MEEKAQLAPPVISSPEEGEDVEYLLVKGIGVPGASIFFSASQDGAWTFGTDVKQDTNWSFNPHGESFKEPGDQWIRVRQERHWPPETSEPSEKRFYKKLLERPVIIEPARGGSLPPIKQTISGRGYPIPYKNVIEIELIKIRPLPSCTYTTSIETDTAGSWRATPDWVVIPGEYVLKAREVFTDFWGKEHLSKWTEDLEITVQSDFIHAP